MPEPAPAGETPAAPEATAAEQAATVATAHDPGQSQSQEPEEEQFDLERAMRTIKALRAEAKQAKAHLKELDHLRAEREAQEQAKMSEQERTALRLKQLEAELEHERAERRDRTNHYEVQLQASRLGIVDPDAAVKLLDWGQLEYDDDGRPKDVDRALKLLLKERPYLAGESGSPQPRMNPTNPATRGPQPGQRIYTSAELTDRAFYLAHRDDIVLAMRQGRIVD